MAGAGGLLIWLQRDTAFVADEFTWLLWAGIEPFSQVFHPYNGHLIAVPLLTFKAILETFGGGHDAFAIFDAVLLVTSIGLLYELARRRIGPWLALGPVVLLMFASIPWLMEPLLAILTLLSIVSGLAALLALERDDRVGECLCCLFLIISLASFSASVGFVVAAGARVALRPTRWRAIWAVALPTLLYLGWRHWASGLPETTSTGISTGNVPLLPLYFGDSVSAVVTALFGAAELGQHAQATSLFLSGFDAPTAARAAGLGALTIAALVLITVLLRRRRPLPMTLWVALAALVTLWVLQGVALAEGRLASETRYLFPGAVLLILVLVEVAAVLPRPPALVLSGAVLVVVGLATNVPQINDGRTFVADYSRFARPDLAALELDGPDADPGFNPAVNSNSIASGALYATVGPYLELVRRFGSSAIRPSSLASQPVDVRAQVDQLLVVMLGLRPQPAGTARSGGCSRFPRGPAADPALPPDGAVLESNRDAELELRRFAADSYVDLGRLHAGRPQLLRVPADRLDQPWRLRQPAGVNIAVCPLAKPLSSGHRSP